MKKIYQTPSVNVTVVQITQMIATSFSKNDTGADANVVLIKDNSASTPDYNVWDDDWSNNN